MEGKSKVYLEGAIDRIDITDMSEFRIIDYKSSDKTTEIPKVINGLSLLPITYLSVIQESLLKNQLQCCIRDYYMTWE